jgi:hypothetical protein
MDPITILAAFLPVIADGAKRLINNWTGGPKPTSVEEVMKLGDLEIRKLEALASIDNAEGASQWVVNARAMQRPVAVLLITIAWFVVVAGNYPPAVIDLVSNLASSVVFYLFGDRTYMYLKRGK